jgi:sec-independent protein translocase protein TatA
MSGQEIFVIIIVALLLFGAEKLPDIAKGLGKGMRDFRKATDEIRREIETSTRDIRQDLNEVTDTIKKDVINVPSFTIDKVRKV